VANGTLARHSWHGGSQWRRSVWLEEQSDSKGAEASGKAEVRRAERKRRGTRTRRGSYAGIKTRHARGGGGCMGCAWSGRGERRLRRREVVGGDQATAASPRARSIFQTLKFKTVTFPKSKIHQILHRDS
jgi:hypothetical protein